MINILQTFLRRTFVLLSPLLFATASGMLAVASADEADGFRPMLNGKDLTGWVLVNTPPETWSFEDGMLVCTGKPIGEMRTEKMYQNFIMEVEWRHLVPKGNAGIFVWADDITAKGQPFHRGIEVQVLENAYGNTRSYTPHGDIFPIHGAKMTPINGRGGSRAFPTEERANPSPEWNHYRIECNEGRIALSVNGKLVTQGTDCSPSKGYICIESEGGVVHYRNMRIKELPDTPVSDQDVAIANRGYRSIYSGLSLDGWKTTADGHSSWKANDWTLSFDGSVTGPSAALTSVELFDSVSFIVDVKLNEASTASINFGDPTAADTVKIDLKTVNSEVLSKPGAWNRIEGKLLDQKLSVSVNGTNVIDNKLVASRTAKTPLVLLPTGSVNFANIYVKSLDQGDGHK